MSGMQVNIDTRAAFAWEGRQQRRVRRSHRIKVDLVGGEEAVFPQRRRRGARLPRSKCDV